MPLVVMVPRLAGVPEPVAGQEQGFVPRKEQLHGLGINRLQQECKLGRCKTHGLRVAALGTEQQMGCSTGTWLSPPIPPPSRAHSPQSPAPPLPVSTGKRVSRGTRGRSRRRQLFRQDF